MHLGRVLWFAADTRQCHLDFSVIAKTLPEGLPEQCYIFYPTQCIRKDLQGANPAQVQHLLLKSPRTHNLLGVQCSLSGLRGGFWPRLWLSFLLLLWGYCSLPGPPSVNSIYTNPVVSSYFRRDSSFLLLTHPLCSKIMCAYRYSFQLRF